MRLFSIDLLKPFVTGAHKVVLARIGIRGQQNPSTLDESQLICDKNFVDRF